MGVSQMEEIAMDEEVKWLGRTSLKAVEAPALRQVVMEKVDVKSLISTFPYTPYYGRLVVFELEIEQVSGIFVPESSRRDGEMRTNEGYVIAIGENVNFCKPNDIVLYGRFSGFWQEVNGRRYRIMNEEDVIALKRESNNA